jgi:putative SOS response-associated peptidase YedK
VCGRYTLTSHEEIVEDLEASLDPNVETNQWWKPRFNVAPTQDAPVVTLRDGTRTIEMMRWGLVPFWAKGDSKKAPLMINARVEGIDTKPMFRDLLGRKRCLVPADGFFEWKAHGKKKQPLWIHPEPKKIVAFAGLWARAPRREAPNAIDKQGEARLYSFTIITGTPNSLVAPIHDRMPLVLDRSQWAMWLDPSLDADAAHALLVTPPADGWRAEPVSPWVNAADHDDPQCIEPEAPPTPGSLFD